MDTKELEGMSVVTEQGMFGDLGVDDPNVRDLKKKKKKFTVTEDENDADQK